MHALGIISLYILSSTENLVALAININIFPLSIHNCHLIAISFKFHIIEDKFTIRLSKMIDEYGKSYAQ